MAEDGDGSRGMPGGFGMPKTRDRPARSAAGGPVDDPGPDRDPPAVTVEYRVAGRTMSAPYGADEMEAAADRLDDATAVVVRDQAALPCDRYAALADRYGPPDLLVDDTGAAGAVYGDPVDDRTLLDGEVPAGRGYKSADGEM